VFTTSVSVILLSPSFGSEEFEGVVGEGEVGAGEAGLIGVIGGPE
jgi:hypothetical protein